MPVFKLTTLFELATTIDTRQPIRTAGWSESHYTSADATISDVYLRARDGSGGYPSLWNTRAAMLPASGSIVGWRVQQIGTALGPSKSGILKYPGNSALSTDQPGVAIEVVIRAAGGLPNVSRQLLRGIPDTQVEGGAWNPTFIYAGLVNQYYSALRAWSFAGRNLAGPYSQILSVTDAGVATLAEPGAFANDDVVRVLRTLKPDGKKVGGIQKIASVAAGGGQVTFADWQFGITAGGRLRKEFAVYPLYGADSAEVKQATYKKPGRPFDLYRGRAPVKP